MCCHWLFLLNLVTTQYFTIYSDVTNIYNTILFLHIHLPVCLLSMALQLYFTFEMISTVQITPCKTKVSPSIYYCVPENCICAVEGHHSMDKLVLCLCLLEILDTRRASGLCCLCEMVIALFVVSFGTADHYVLHEWQSQAAVCSHVAVCFF